MTNGSGQRRSLLEAPPGPPSTALTENTSRMCALGSELHLPLHHHSRALSSPHTHTQRSTQHSTATLSTQSHTQSPNHPIAPNHPITQSQRTITFMTSWCLSAAFIGQHEFVGCIATEPAGDSAPRHTAAHWNVTVPVPRAGRSR